MIAERLHRFISQVLQEPVFRRRLRYHPREALQDHGLSGARAPENLGVKHYQIADPFAHANPEALLRGAPQPGLALKTPLDMRLVLYGVKPMALVHGSEAELATLGAWARQRGLTAALSPYQFEYRPDEGKAAYTNLQQPAPAVPGSGAWRGLLVSPCEQSVILGWLSLLFQWDLFLGNLLGYPSCCTERFEARWPQACQAHQGDVVPMILSEGGAGPFDWRTNILGRYFGVELLLHFPCNFSCEPSIALADRYRQALALWEGEQKLESVLRAPALFSSTSGVFVFMGGKFEGETLHYDPSAVLATDKTSPLAKIIGDADQLTANAPKLDEANAQLVDFTKEA